MLDRYIVHRWRRDVKRAHTRVKVNYVGLGSTPGQVRYDEMCLAFSDIADLAADDEEWSRAIMEWIKMQADHMRTAKVVEAQQCHLW